MSNVNAIGVIAAIFVSGGFLIMYVLKAQNEAGHEILTGVIRGLSVSTKDRWLMLFQTWIPRAALVLAFQFFFVMTFMTIARDTNDAGVRWLAYAGAAFTSLGFFGQLLFSISTFVRYSSTLRQAERS